MDETLKELWARYHALTHAMQSGVEFTMNREPSQVEPKHLRVGVNSALVEHTALVKLLMEAGLLNERAYVTSLVSEMEAEVLRYRQTLAKLYGVDIETIKLA